MEAVSLPLFPVLPEVPMSHTKLALLTLSLVVVAGAFAQTQPSASPAMVTGPYRVAKTYRIGGAGGWDYLTVDPKHKLLYVPRSTHTMVVDAASGKTVADVPGQQRNHGVAIVPSAGRGFISDGQDASVTIFDLKTNKVLGKVKAADDADGIIYDPNCGKVLVSCGDANAMVVISPDVDPQTGKADVTVALDGKPEFLVADRDKICVNLVDRDQVAVIDSKTMKVIHKWPTAPGGSPVGMAMDPVGRRLFVGCRKPQKLIVMSADDGKVLADLPIGAGVDATAFDGDVFASCRDGTLTIARETSPGKFAIVQTVATKMGARTMGLDPTTHTLYLPTAETVGKSRGRSRPALKPGSFTILVVQPAEK
jgi:DNA-binding beta-propeller fold protein YncE